MNCKKCDNYFPSYVWINGKKQSLTSRSYCLDCSPFNKKKGYELRRKKTREDKGNGESKKECPICGRIFNWTKNNVCSTCRTALQRWIKKRKAIKLLGGCCKTCGINDVDVLTFHHKDKNQKKFELGDSWANTKWLLIEEELKKCELLCFNCHMKMHRKEAQKKILEYYQVEKAE